MDFNKIKDLCVIVLGNKEYLGVLDEYKKTISEAMEYGEEGYSIRHWFEMANVGELISVEIGPNQGFSKRALNSKERSRLVYCESLMRGIKQYALQHFENDLFNRFYKKER